jgi:SRSO17 transposase
MALEQITQLAVESVPAAPIVADGGYGVVTAFRDALTAHGIAYVVGISTETTVWAPGRAPLPPPKYRGHGRPPTLVRRTRQHRPLSVRTLAQHLPASAWHTVTWRQGTRGAMRSRFAVVRVRPTHRDDWRSTPRPEEWLLIEWQRGEAAPIKYWLTTLPPTATPADLVRLAMLRWRIERDYQELKDELGLDHFEGRGWRGFHHHASLCIAAYAFLAAGRSRCVLNGTRPTPSRRCTGSSRGPWREDDHVPPAGIAHELL